MKRLHFCFLFVCFLLPFGGLWAQTRPADTVRLDFVPFLDATNAVVQATPMIQFNPIEVIGEGNSRSFIPGQPKFSGHLVLQRPFVKSNMAWRSWLDDFLESSESRRSVRLLYTGLNTSHLMVWNGCVPVRHEIAPASDGTMVERLYMLVTGFSAN